MGLRAIIKLLDIMAAGGHYWMSDYYFRSQLLPFQIDTQLIIIIEIIGLYGRRRPLLDWIIMSVIELVRDIWMNYACIKFELRSFNYSLVIALITKFAADGGGAAAAAAAAAALLIITYCPSNNLRFSGI